MKKFNLIKEYVHTKYGDLTGVIQVDCHDNISDLYKLCEDNNIETDNIFILGFGFGESTMRGIGLNDHIVVQIYYINNDMYGDSYDTIQAKLRVDKKIVAKRMNISIRYTELHKYIKRYEFIAMSDLINSVDEFEIEEYDEI